MNDRTDSELLRAYAEQGSEQAFGELVRRHLGFVYSAARRMVRDAQLAEDVTQAVFVALAKNPGSLTERPVLAGWLHRTAQNIAAQTVRTEVRRQIREQEAAAMNELLAHGSDAPWEEIASHLDAALGELSEAHRDAVLLRYFERRSAQEMAQTLGVSEDAAQRRVSRAVEHLRQYFAKRSIAIGASGLIAVICGNAVQAAPAGLAAAIVGAAVARTAGSAAATTAARAFSRGAKKITAGIAAIALGIAISIYLQYRAGKSHPPQLAAQPLSSSVTASANSSRPDDPIGARRPGGAGETLSAELAARSEPFSTNAQFTLDTSPGAVAIQPNGKILAAATLGGWFIDQSSGTLGWFTRGAMRFNADGTLDRSFYCDVGRPEATAAFMSHLCLAPDGRVFVSGLFDAVDGKTRPGYSMLLSDGRVDEAFTPWRGSTNLPGRTFLPGGTYPATLLSDGTVAIMSASVHGPRAPHPWTAYRLDASGQLIEPVYKHTEELGFPPGLILTLGWSGFWARKPVDWTREAPARPFHWMPPGTQRPPITDLAFDQWIDPPTATQAAIVFQELFDEVPLELCRYAVKLPDGGTVLAVSDGTPIKSSGRVMHFDKDWRPDLSFTNAFEADPRSWLTLRRLPDGRFLLAGLVGRIDGEDFPGLVRLQPDGTIDRTFRCRTDEGLAGRIFDFAVQADGHIVICGDFTHVNGTAALHLARLNSDGAIDFTFKPPFLTLPELDQRRFVRIARLAGKPALGSASTSTSDASDSAPAETILINSLNLGAKLATIHFTGRPGQFYVLQARETLSTSEWIKVSTNRAGPTGLGELRDEQPGKSTMRFYRIATP